MLRITLDDGRKLFSHLGMTGKWVAREASEPAVKSEKLRLDLSAKRGKPATVRLFDPRMFGRLILSRSDVAGWAELGPDPLATPIDPTWLHQRLAGSKRSIKEKLLDQSLIAGVGNIYATEALWKAKVDPRSAAGAIGRKELAALARAIKWTMDLSIARQITEERDAEISYLEEARSRNPFLIYGRGGEMCPRCKNGHLLAKIVLGGRGTVFCPNCQVRYSAAKNANTGKSTKATSAATPTKRAPRRAPGRTPRAAKGRS
jgi:formamidopyrimidine-DNA glycosylase